MEEANGDLPLEENKIARTAGVAWGGGVTHIFG